MMIEIINKPWDYRFFKSDKKYYISVMCGSVGVFEISIKLNEEEVFNYNKFGLTFIDELARKIQYSPPSYSDRNLPNEFLNSSDA